ncbi:type II toxin-antitoxin system RelE family toxin [Streptomyces clavuligerus]|uniref:Uncharacterized protein n=1 Tax=Streptomyces clavuligerus TaxID=1901 RepID=B5GPJ5_STRCL|nr:hypothetical protein [Streptomyces clavuligerus]ANW19617.1 hypothetical protein BB341_16010 [Streptomyces clavuligerus]AXU14223.1 hypothetical protein D1794_16695 [Streptomyces clavuligerus]EDY48241.1 conserved hypothetical protein [Streptomyces clavuligerus]EFG07564.1 Hypothetical protein SCLAV_2491 [Streptomyces clavuligerus]MBY6304223.1 hypothetical protein [Streptomyces clavuligerus]
MKSARYAFAAHPEALEDLRNVPGNIRDLALLELQHLVHGNERGARMHRELAGCHKVYVDPQTRWRMVFQFRDAPPSSQHRREIFLVAVGERYDNTVYRTAADRLRREAAAGTDQRAEAARARSPHMRTTGTPPVSPTAAPTAATAPAAQRRTRT